MNALKKEIAEICHVDESVNTPSIKDIKQALFEMSKESIHAYMKRYIDQTNGNVFDLNGSNAKEFITPAQFVKEIERLLGKKLDYESIRTPIDIKGNQLNRIIEDRVEKDW